MGIGRQRPGPCNIAVAGGVVGVMAFGEDPFVAGENFPEGEEIGGDVRFGFGESFFSDRELVHEGKSEVVFFGTEIDGEKAAGKLLGGFPADLAAETGLVAGALEAGQLAEKAEENGFEEIPIVGSDGKQRPQPELGTLRLIDIEGGEIAIPAGGDVETQTEAGILEFCPALSGMNSDCGGGRIEKAGELFMEEMGDLVFPGGLG